MNATYVKEYVTDLVEPVSEYWYVYLLMAICTIVYLYFKKQKKQVPVISKDFEQIYKDMNKVQEYNIKSEEELKKYLTSKLVYIKRQGIAVKLKYSEVIKMNDYLKQNYIKVKKQLAILK